MGKETNGNTDRNITKPESKTDSVKTGTSGNRSTKTTGTGTGKTGTTGTTGTATGTTSTGNTKTVKNEKVGKVSVLGELPDVNIPEPQQPKQKRKYTKKAKEENNSFDSKQITAFIVAVSSMVASREGMSHWLISEAEAEQIAKPLSNIIAKSEHLKVLGEHADAFALVSACLMIFAPRLIITLQTNKSKKGVKKLNVTGKHNNDTKSTNSNNKAHRENAVAPSDDNKTIFESISPIQ